METKKQNIAKVLELNIQEIAQTAGMKIRAAKAAEQREKYGNNTIVLFAVGDRYEAYDESAEALHDICNQPLFFMGNISSTDFRKECTDWIYPKMIREGYKLCVFEQGEY